MLTGDVAPLRLQAALSMAGIFAIVVIGLPLSALYCLLTFFLTRRRPHAVLAVGAAAALIPLSCWYLAGAVLVSSGYLSLRGLDRWTFEIYDTPLGHGYAASSEDALGSGRLSGPGLAGRDWTVIRTGCAGPLVVLHLDRGNPEPSYAVLGSTPTFRAVPTLAALESSLGRPVQWGEDREPPVACAPRQLWIDTLVQRVLFGLPLAWLAGSLILTWTVWPADAPVDR